MLMKKAIVTGASSMIGVALINFLLIEDYEIIAITRPNSKKIDNIPKDENVSIVECDLSNLTSSEIQFIKNQIDRGSIVKIN